MALKKVGARKAPAASAVRARAIANGYRSGLEETIAEQLKAHGIEGVFEALKIHYTPPLKVRTYTPDFPLPNGIVVESKGLFKTDDRTKHKNIKAEHPDLDIRFVFSNSRQKLSKGSPTTYGKWCETNGFLYADKVIPEEWLQEPPDPVRIAALADVTVPPKKSTT